jgi:hypothetical protein
MKLSLSTVSFCFALSAFGCAASEEIAAEPNEEVADNDLVSVDPVQLRAAFEGEWTSIPDRSTSDRVYGGYSEAEKVRVVIDEHRASEYSVRPENLIVDIQSIKKGKFRDRHAFSNVGEKKYCSNLWSAPTDMLRICHKISFTAGVLVHIETDTIYRLGVPIDSNDSEQKLFLEKGELHYEYRIDKKVSESIVFAKN